MMKKRMIYLALVLLGMIHQDFWLWNDPTLVFGFLPIGLAYHALHSIAAAAVWFLAVKHAWPEELESFAQGKPEQGVRRG